MWHGRKALLLDEYLNNKIRLQELKRLPKRYRVHDENKEIQKIETDIREFISMLDRFELRSLILMSLDMDLRG